MKDTEKVVAAYVRLRDEIDRVSKEHKLEIQALVAKQEKLLGYLAKILDESNLKSLTTQAGTAFRATKDSVRVADKEEFGKYVVDRIMAEGQDALSLLTLSANKTVIKQFMQDNEDHLPPGIAYDSWSEIQVRRA